MGKVPIHKGGSSMGRELSIGDIKTTARTDLDSKWLPCDGRTITREAYPELHDLMPSGKGLGDAWEAGLEVGETTFRDAAFGNGYWVVVGDGGTIQYSKLGPYGPWVKTNQSSSTLYSVVFENGYWVAVGGMGTILYKAGTPTGTWSVATAGTNQNLHSVTYGNGYWVAVGIYRTVLYKAGTPTGTWSNVTIGSVSVQTGFMTVAYGNGYWVILHYDGLVYTNGAPTGTWFLNNTVTDLYGLAYGNGYWVCGGASGKLYYTNGSPVGGMSYVNIGLAKPISSLSYVDGHWFAVFSTDNSVRYTGGDPAGAWLRLNYYGSSNIDSKVISGNGYLALADTRKLSYLATEKSIPKLSDDKAYSYILALA